VGRYVSDGKARGTEFGSGSTGGEELYVEGCEVGAEGDDVGFVGDGD